MDPILSKPVARLFLPHTWRRRFQILFSFLALVYVIIYYAMQKAVEAAGTPVFSEDTLTFTNGVMAAGAFFLSFFCLFRLLHNRSGWLNKVKWILLVGFSPVFWILICFLTMEPNNKIWVNRLVSHCIEESASEPKCKEALGMMGLHNEATIERIIALTPEKYQEKITRILNDDGAEDEGPWRVLRLLQTTSLSPAAGALYLTGQFQEYEETKAAGGFDPFVTTVGNPGKPKGSPLTQTIVIEDKGCQQTLDVAKELPLFFYVVPKKATPEQPATNHFKVNYCIRKKLGSASTDK